MSIGKGALTKTLIGFFTGPIGGAYYGYQFVENKNQLAELQGEPAQHNHAVHVALGIVGGSISGAIYGAQCARQEAEIEVLLTRRFEQHQLAERSSTQSSPALEKAQQPDYWQNAVATQEAAQKDNGPGLA